MHTLIFLLPDWNPNSAKFELKTPAEEPTGSIDTNRSTFEEITKETKGKKNKEDYLFNNSKLSLWSEDQQKKDQKLKQFKKLMLN
ncbi:hypothetical protein G9A89_003444 [Geosiphon pyriformis]|nr:hypothetical protein G9A89_003444 [Geosiphon pyriformis]